jgi:acyl carrier protein phosphodiesterase
MNTYGPKDYSTYATSFWQHLSRWLDRERELICLRNVVGMMSEGRRADAKEYHEMQAAQTKLQAALNTSKQRVLELEEKLSRVSNFPKHVNRDGTPDY